jgi:PAS domain-containing protein
MEFCTESGKENIERELSRLIGYRLLGWSIISLWAVAVVTLFRIFKNYPPAIDSWLLWVAPLLILRALGTAIVHKQLRVAVNIPSSRVMRRYSLLSGVCDGVILLSACILAYSAASVAPAALTIFVMASLASLSLVYMFTPRVTATLMVQVVVPAIALVFAFGVKIPVEFLLLGMFVLVGTALGVNQFKSLYLGQLKSKFAYEKEIFHAAESNFIFNQHWQKMQLAAIDWDRDFVIKSWNPAAEKLFGVPASQAQGKSLDLLFEEGVAAEIRNEWLHGSSYQDCPALRVFSLADDKVATLWYDTPLLHDGELIGIASFVVSAADDVIAKLTPSIKAGLGNPRLGTKSPVLSTAPLPAGVKVLSSGERWGSHAAG